MTTSLCTAAELDEEIGLRLQGDLRLSTYTGLPVTGSPSIPGDTDPVYSVLGVLVDLEDGDSLLEGIFALDRRKNSVQSVFNGATLEVTNPRNLLFDSSFNVNNIQSQDLVVSLGGNVGWGEGDADSQTFITIGETPNVFPDGQFCIGAYYSFTYVQSIRSVIRVSTGMQLIGRRGSVRPVSAKPRGLTLLQSIEFLTEADLVIPAESVMMIVRCWGGGGGNDASAGLVASGGAGGFTKQGVQIFNESGRPAWSTYFRPGAAYRVVVGGGGANLSGTVPGFGGVKVGDSRAGGGLSGLFTGAGAVASNALSRAVCIAGGGGGGKVFADTAYAGGNGNAATVRNGAVLVDASMLGASATSDASGGGGGHVPGVSTVAGSGGSGLWTVFDYWANAHLIMWGEGLAQTAGTVAGPVVSPGTSDPRYVPGYGGAGQPGRVVVDLYRA